MGLEPHVPGPTMGAGFQSIAEENPSRVAVLLDANIRLLIARTAIFSGGNSVHTVAIGWLAYDLTQSAVVVGASVGIRSLPLLLLGPVSGVIIDRFNRATLLKLNSVYMVAISAGFTLVIAAVGAEVWHIFTFMVLGGIGYAVNQPARRAVFADVVAGNRLMAALALDSVVFQVARIATPTLVGFAIVKGSVTIAFAGQAVLYGVAVVVTLLLDIPRNDIESVKKESFFTNLTGGLRYIARDPAIRALVLLALVAAFFGGNLIYFLTPVLAAEMVGPEADIVGLLMTANAIGGVAAGSLLVGWALQRSPEWGLIASMTAVGLAVALLPYANGLALATALFGAIGGASIVRRVVTDTMLQQTAHAGFRGRVAAVTTVIQGVGLLSGVLGGFLIESVGLPIAMLSAGSAMIISPWVVRRSLVTPKP